MLKSQTSPQLSSRDQAIAWHVRLEGEATEADWQDFTLWLEADAAHRLAFDEIADLSADVAAQASAIESAEHVLRAGVAEPQGTSRRLWLGAAALAAAGVFLFIAQPWQKTSAPVQATTIATAVGERREVVLEDGSTLDINTDTTLTYALRSDVREIHLEKGEVFFEVSPDPKRPFVVVMGDQRVRVVGTAFNALRHTQRVTVAVNHGVVQVLRDNDALPAVTLSVGDQYIGREKSPEYRVIRVNPAEISSWRDGRLIFQDTPLSDVASELSRYLARPVVIQDPTLSNLRFSGILRIDQESEMLRRLAAFLPISVQENNGMIILQRGPAK